MNVGGNMKKTKTLNLLIVLLTMFALTSCAFIQKTNKRKQIVTTLYPEYDMINKIIEEVTSVIGNIEFSHKLKNIIGFRGKIDGLVADINKSLGEFSPVGNNLLGESLRKMLGELFDARIDLEKPAVIIDWAEFSMPNTVSDYCCRKAKREPRIIWNQDTELRNKVFICDYYENVSFSDGEYPLCLELAEKAGNITEGFSKIVELHNKLSESVCVLHNAAHLPALFKTEVQSVSVYFEFYQRHWISFQN